MNNDVVVCNWIWVVFWLKQIKCCLDTDLGEANYLQLYSITGRDSVWSSYYQLVDNTLVWYLPIDCLMQIPSSTHSRVNKWSMQSKKNHPKLPTHFHRLHPLESTTESIKACSPQCVFFPFFGIFEVNMWPTDSICLWLPEGRGQAVGKYMKVAPKWWSLFRWGLLIVAVWASSSSSSRSLRLCCLMYWRMRFTANNHL